MCLQTYTIRLRQGILVHSKFYYYSNYLQFEKNAKHNSGPQTAWETVQMKVA